MRIRVSLLSLIVVLAGVSVVSAQVENMEDPDAEPRNIPQTEAGQPADQDIEAMVFDGGKLGGMPYRLLKPAVVEPGKTYPLVLCLHGVKGRGTDNTSRGIQAFAALSTPEMRKQYPAYVLTPQCPEKGSWVTDLFDGKPLASYSLEKVPESNDLKLALQIVDEVVKTHPVDPARIYITGQSMGGFGTWDAILRHPGRFAAAVPICGAGDPSQAGKIADLPIWIFHGARDEVVAPAGSREMFEALKVAGNTKVKYVEYRSAGHSSWRNAWKEKELIPWLFAQRK